MPLTIFTAETREVQFVVTGVNLADDQPIDPTASTLTVGFVDARNGGQDPPASFYAASWVANPTRKIYYGEVLVGPLGVVQLAAGTWVPWARFAIGSELIERPVNDTLTVLA